MPTGGAPIPETATTASEAGKSGGETSPKAKSGRRFRPMSFIRTTIRNAPWVVIAVVLHVVAIVALSIIYVRHEKAKDDSTPTAIALGKEKKEAPVEPDVAPEPIVDRTAVPKPRTDVEAEAVSADVPASDAIVDPNAKEDLSQEVGNPDAGPDTSAPSGGTAIGVGAGGGHFGSGKPSAFVSRSAAGTSSSGSGPLGVPPKGATIRTEESVRKGLVWLGRHQMPDGSWSGARMHERCQPDGACMGDKKDVEIQPIFDEGLTGLSLLAFLGHGFGHDSKITLRDVVRQKKYITGEMVKNGLNYLRKRQDAHQDGRFTDDGYMYDEALATLAMCEEYGITGQPIYKKYAQRGVDFLVKNQRLNPGGTGLWGWRYEPLAWVQRIDDPKVKEAYPDEKERKALPYMSDISVTTWAVMALKSAELAGLTVPEESMKGAMDFVKYVTTKDGRVGYMDPLQVGRKVIDVGDAEANKFDFHEGTLEALGMCCRTFIEKNVDDPVLAMSAARIVKDLPAVSKTKMSVDYYYWYYGTLALNQFDGPDNPKRAANGRDWKAWESELLDAITPLQDDTKGTCSSGSWPTPDRWSLAAGPIYRTAINVLTLEVYYRYENAFGREMAKKKAVEGKAEKDRDEKRPAPDTK
jgi:hypothetical protein